MEGRKHGHTSSVRPHITCPKQSSIFQRHELCREQVQMLPRGREGCPLQEPRDDMEAFLLDPPSSLDDVNIRGARLRLL